MDIIPIIRLIGGLLLFGVSFLFLGDALNLLLNDVYPPSAYFAAALWIWSILPGVALIGSAMRHFMIMQKPRY